MFLYTILYTLYKTRTGEHATTVSAMLKEKNLADYIDLPYL